MYVGHMSLDIHCSDIYPSWVFTSGQQIYVQKCLKKIKGERDKTLRPADNAEDATDPWTNLKTTTRRARDRKDSVTRILRMVKR